MTPTSLQSLVLGCTSSPPHNCSAFAAAAAVKSVRCPAQVGFQLALGAKAAITKQENSSLTPDGKLQKLNNSRVGIFSVLGTHLDKMILYFIFILQFQQEFKAIKQISKDNGTDEGGGAAKTITRPSNWGETHRGLVFPKYLLLSHLLRFSVALILFSSCCCCCCCLPKVICLRCRHCVDCNVRSLENGSSNTRGSRLANTSVHLLFQPSM